MNGPPDMTQVCQLQIAGGSIWLDNLSRQLLTSGDFQALIETACLTGGHLQPDDLRPRFKMPTATEINCAIAWRRGVTLKTAFVARARP